MSWHDSLCFFSHLCDDFFCIWGLYIFSSGCVSWSQDLHGRCLKDFQGLLVHLPTIGISPVYTTLTQSKVISKDLASLFPIWKGSCYWSVWLMLLQNLLTKPTLSSVIDVMNTAHRTVFFFIITYSSILKNDIVHLWYGSYKPQFRNNYE